MTSLESGRDVFDLRNISKSLQQIAIHISNGSRYLDKRLNLELNESFNKKIKENLSKWQKCEMKKINRNMGKGLRLFSLDT